MRDPADSPADEGAWEPGQGLMLRGVVPMEALRAG
jgi:hypothetical protein